MKKQFLLALTFAAVLGTACSQTLFVRTYMEKTSVGMKAGTAVAKENKYGWEYGGFYQESSIMESVLNELEREQLPSVYERNFVGLFFAAPVLTSEKVNFKFNVRTGVTNGEYFVITPSLQGTYCLTRKVRFGLGIGLRSFSSTMLGSIDIAIN